MKDLVILVADKNAEYALRGVLSRPRALGTRPIQFDVLMHVGRDGGARKSGPEILALERKRFHHALLVFDFEGSGANSPDGVSLEEEMDHRLSATWGDAAKAIVIEPELDVWIWGGGNAVEEVIGWTGATSIREWLVDNGYSLKPNGKPSRPKEALEAALRIPAMPRSSSLYKNIAEKLSLRRCSDAAFMRLRSQLLGWFAE